METELLEGHREIGGKKTLVDGPATEWFPLWCTIEIKGLETYEVYLENIIALTDLMFVLSRSTTIDHKRP